MSVRPNGPSIAEPASLCLAWERRCHRCWQQIDLLGRSSDGKEATDVQQFPSMTWREHEDQRRRHPSSPMSWDRTTAQPASAPHGIDPSTVARVQNEFRSPWPDRSPQFRSPDRDRIKTASIGKAGETRSPLALLSQALLLWNEIKSIIFYSWKIFVPHQILSSITLL